MLYCRSTYSFLVAPRARISSLLLLALFLEGFFLSSCRSGRKMQEDPVEVEVRQVGFDHLSNSPVVILQDKSGKRTMPIWIGISEAQAIALQLQGALPPRPLIHDLVKDILEHVGVEIDRVLVSELKGSTYYARIHLLNGKQAMEVDSRPSDAIALALRFHRPIFVERTLFESTPTTGERERETAQGAAEQPIGLKLFGMTVQELTADLAAYFELPAPEGVLVADVDKGHGADRLQRGDVIVAVNGERVRNIGELRRRIEQKHEEGLTLLVRRDGEEIPATLSTTSTKTQTAEEDLE